MGALPTASAVHYYQVSGAPEPECVEGTSTGALYTIIPFTNDGNWIWQSYRHSGSTPGSETGLSRTVPNGFLECVAVDSDGNIVVCSGDAGNFGSMGGERLAGPVVAMASTPDGRGYVLAGSSGELFGFGYAQGPAAPSGTSSGAIVGVVIPPLHQVSTHRRSAHR